MLYFRNLGRAVVYTTDCVVLLTPGDKVLDIVCFATTEEAQQFADVITSIAIPGGGSACSD